MKDSYINLVLPRVLLIGSAGRNSGKTTLACNLINRYNTSENIYALKIISIEKANSGCQRGGKGCGICTSLSGKYELIEEDAKNIYKDTSKMLIAGASKSFLLKTLKNSIEEAFCEFVKLVPDDAIIIVESNSLRKFVVPGLFVFADNNQKQMKQSAKEVYKYADLFLNSSNLDLIDKITISKNISGKMWSVSD